ncbi:VQ motif-containing protein 20 [Cicer arietinum]|uniref:VQ motif-containing protein 20 n=1 Tax=Cicer arietinum TaxID=3827 RepID=A0A1S2Z0P0_CICAR|nr:VQ motif-containing protein 20 [Cicer arietinum]
MKPSQFHAKKEITSTTITTKSNINGMLPPHLKINKDSHFIKKSLSTSSQPSSSSSSSSSTSSSLANGMGASNKPPQQPRHPVIIYTHSPRVIHTHPRDFMTLVQKLTGLSRSEGEDGGSNVPSSQHQKKQEPVSNVAMAAGVKENDRKNVVIVRNEDNDTSSITTNENNCGNISKTHVNSCYIASETPMLEPLFNPYMTNFLAPSTTDFMCSSQPFLNYSDSLFSHNMRTSIPTPATLGGLKEFGDYRL